MLLVPLHEIEHRIAALQALLLREDVQAAVIRQNADMYYFAGTVQDAHLIVPAQGRPLLLVRRDVQRAEAQSPLRPVVPLPSVKALPGELANHCGADAVDRLGMELDVLPAATFLFYREKLFPRQRIVDVSGLIRRVRMVKSAWEIEMMRGAAGISRAVADAVPDLLREGLPELELSAELEMVARKAGHLGLIRMRAFNMDMYFGHILSGPEAAIPAYADAPTGGPGLSPAFGQGPGRRRIARNEIVSVDIMSNHNGYLNDQTRNFCLGDPPPRLRDAYRLVEQIHALARAQARPGTVTGDLYEVVWQRVTAAGWGDFFMGHDALRVKFIGHGLGLEVDEFPFIAQGQQLALAEGMTFAFEPKFSLPGIGIAGLENTYLVTAGGLESLNTAREDLVLLA